MITNSDRSGRVRVKLNEPNERAEKPRDDIRSGKVSETSAAPKPKKFGDQKHRKIVSVNGQLELVED